MITLEKLLKELNAESINEIIAGCGGSKVGSQKGYKPKSVKRVKGKSGGSSHSSSSGKTYISCGCSYVPPAS